MASLICGSLAFDTIMDFEGRFAEQILPDQLHILNVSFLVPALRRDFGGCAGNIAYSLKILGGTPLPMATLGTDAADYLQRLKALGISTEYVPPLQAIEITSALATLSEFAVRTNMARKVIIRRTKSFPYSWTPV
jgi:adenosine kinase